MSTKKYQMKNVGEIHKTNEGYDCEIIDGGSKVGYVVIQRQVKANPSELTTQPKKPVTITR